MVVASMKTRMSPEAIAAAAFWHAVLPSLPSTRSNFTFGASHSSTMLSVASLDASEATMMSSSSHS
jgi:hypothetical protein